VVFVTGLEDGVFPSLRNGEDEDAIEEERRLAYVAITRAKEFFSLSWPQYHNGKTLGPSLFLDEMPTLAPLVESARNAAQEAAEEEASAVYFESEEDDLAESALGDYDEADD